MRSANYVEETSTSIAGTNGDGVINLTALAKTPRFSTAFGSTNTTIRYVIEDTANKKFETGIGVVGGNTLTRTKPQITWDGISYDDSNPAPIQFGTTPPANTIKIRLSATAESQGAVIPGYIHDNISGKDANWGSFPISAHYGNWSNTGGGQAIGNDKEVYSYYRLDQPGLLTGVQVECTTAVATTVLKSALYSINNQGYPSQKIVGFNDLDMTTTGFKVDQSTATWSTGGPVWLSAGWYAFGMTSYIGSTGIRIFLNGASAGFSQTPIGRTSSYAGYKNSISVPGGGVSGMPNVPNLTGALINTSAGHWIGLKVES